VPPASIPLSPSVADSCSLDDAPFGSDRKYAGISCESRCRMSLNRFVRSFCNINRSYLPGSTRRPRDNVVPFCVKRCRPRNLRSLSRIFKMVRLPGVSLTFPRLRPFGPAMFTLTDAASNSREGSAVCANAEMAASFEIARRQTTQDDRLSYLLFKSPQRRKRPTPGPARH